MLFMELYFGELQFSSRDSEIVSQDHSACTGLRRKLWLVFIHALGLAVNWWHGNTVYSFCWRWLAVDELRGVYSWGFCGLFLSLLSLKWINNYLFEERALSSQEIILNGCYKWLYKWQLYRFKNGAPPPRLYSSAVLSILTPQQFKIALFVCRSGGGLKVTKHNPSK